MTRVQGCAGLLVIVLAATALARPRCTSHSGNGIAAAKAVLAHLVHRDVHVRLAWQVAGGADERVVVEDVDDAADRGQLLVLAHLILIRRFHDLSTRARLARTSAAATATTASAA